MIEPPKPSRGMDVLAWCLQVWQWVRYIRPKVGDGLSMRQTADGIIISLQSSGMGGRKSTPAACPFGKIVTTTDDPPEKAVLGGLVQCGDKNFAVADHTLTTSSDGEWLVQLTLSGIECATDDDGEIFLPGVITASGTPEWGLKVATGPTDYDDNTNPTSPASPNGTIVLPVGRLKITDGSPSLMPTGCGNFTVGQCAGILNFSRA